jgi:hypothetical protein
VYILHYGVLQSHCSSQRSSNSGLPEPSAASRSFGVLPKDKQSEDSGVIALNGVVLSTGCTKL